MDEIFTVALTFLLHIGLVIFRVNFDYDIEVSQNLYLFLLFC